eukprot:3088028-Pyramimonas_sp.AAC.1
MHLSRLGSKPETRANSSNRRASVGPCSAMLSITKAVSSAHAKHRTPEQDSQILSSSTSATT